MTKTSKMGKKISNELDEDARTNQLCEEMNKNSFATLKNKTINLITTITGAQKATRQRLFYEIQSNSDIKVWSVHKNKQIKCVKVFNPTILLDKSSDFYKHINDAQRLEVEDPEGILKTLPRGINTTSFEMVVITWTRIKKIPKCFFHKNLRYLNVQRNRLNALKGIENASALEVFNAKDNCLPQLPSSLNYLHKLSNINISNNLLRQLPDFLPNLKNLKQLDCSNNQLKRLPCNIGYACLLTFLDLSSNQITDIPYSIGNLGNLIDFKASCNNICHLPKTFCHLHKLKYLNLRSNRFTKVPPELKGLHNLQHLNLKNNHITDFVYPLPFLRHLNLDKNKFKKISPQLLECCKLETLSLQCNNINTIHTSINKLSSLKLLYLSSNPFESLPETLSHLTHLKQLYLCHTPIDSLPHSLRHMSSLKHISLDDCSNLDAYLKLEWKNYGVDGVKSYLHEKLEELENNTLTKPNSRSSNYKEEERVRDLERLSQCGTPVKKDTHLSRSKYASFFPCVENNNQSESSKQMVSVADKNTSTTEMEEMGGGEISDDGEVEKEEGLMDSHTCISLSPIVVMAPRVKSIILPCHKSVSKI